MMLATVSDSTLGAVSVVVTLTTWRGAVSGAAGPGGDRLGSESLSEGGDMPMRKTIVALLAAASLALTISSSTVAH